jgi:hypothetical protein
MNGAGELDLLGGQVVIGIFAELLAENQNAVQRRSQLMRHVGKKFRLVLGSEREFFCLLFQSAAGLLDFLILSFYFDVLLGKLLCFLSQLFVGLLQFFLLGLEFRCELLRLLEQTFGLHRSFNAVQHNADAGSELLQKSQMGSGEGVQGRQFDHRFYPIFEEYRKNNDISRNRLKQTGANWNCRLRQV